MTETARHDLPHLPPAASRLGAVFARPKVLAVDLRDRAGGARLAGARPDVCRHRSVRGAVPGACPACTAAWGAQRLRASSRRCGRAMTLAMMLPSAAPMILTYAEIADTAARKGERIVSPFVLAAGYTLVWLGFAAVATLAQYRLHARRAARRRHAPRRAGCSPARSSSAPASTSSPRSSTPA